jgi:hypothetical protein
MIYIEIVPINPSMAVSQHDCTWKADNILGALALDLRGLMQLANLV